MKRLLWITLAAMASPLSAAFGPELPVTPPVLGNVSTLQTGPEVTTGSEEFFVIWTDHRAGSPDAMATRLDTRGNVSNPSGIVLGRNIEASSAVAPTRNYLVALTENCSRVYTVTVDSLTGAVGPQRPIGTVSRCGSVDLATNGETVLAVMDAGGALLDVNGVPVFESFALPEETVGGATNGRDYMVAATPKTSAEGRDVVVAEVSRRGEVGSFHVVEHDVPVSSAAIAANGSSYLVIWTTDVAVKAAEISGSVTIGPIRTLATGTGFRSPKLAWAGGDYRVAYIDGGAGSVVRQMRVDASGTIIDTPVDYSGPGQVETPSLAALPQFKGVAVWPAPGEGLVAGFFDPGVSVDRPYSMTTQLTYMATPQGFVSAGSTGSHAVIVWTEGKRLLARRTNGQTTGSDVVAVATLTAETSRRADVEFDGSFLWISWRDENVVFTRRYNSDLTPRDPAPIRVAERAEHFDSVAGSGRVLFTWTGEPFIFAGVMTPADSVSPQAAIVSREQLSGSAIAGAWTGSSFLVGWARQVSADIQELRTARVSPAGGILDSTSRLIASNVNPISALDLASTGFDAVAVWQRGSDSAISYRPLNLDGSPAGSESSVPIEALSRRLEQTIAFQGRYYLATSSVPQSLRVRYTLRTLFGDHETVADVDAVESARAMGIAPVGNGLLATYVRRADEAASGGVSRLFMRVSEDLAAPARRRAVRH